MAAIVLVVAAMAKAIFPAAVNIVNEYPSAKAFNAVKAFLASKVYLSDYKSKEGFEAQLKAFDDNVDAWHRYLEKYKETLSVLQSYNDDPKAKALTSKVKVACEEQFKKMG